MILSSTASLQWPSLFLFTSGNPKAVPTPLKLTPPFYANSVKFRLCVAPKSIGAGTQRGQWEEPDYGSESDSEEEEEEDVRDDWTSQTDNEEEQSLTVFPAKNGKAIDEEYKALVKEVELLLTPEEQALLKQNDTPVLSKISTTLALSAQMHSMDKLIEHGVDIDSVDKDGFTALHWAVMGKQEAVISHLLRKGANLHVSDKDGATPLHYAVQVGAMQTVKLLIKYKVDVNVADHEGWTPLHVAIQSRCRDIAKVLLINGADKTRRNKDGKTPLDLSLSYGKDFKSYELAKLVKLVPANRDLRPAA
ncbi:ankyrin repeat domain-containing protein EMB506, chloroplastic-like isoform X2 [Aristolochia californica]|uniref:ankyrin repeat domain-containing protein EMB506, chloroplastic-like isoform X2 n=1 Tax=Aristolochia californica TaxID=171875 RepID=UPI0035D7CB13